MGCMDSGPFHLTSNLQSPARAPLCSLDLQQQLHGASGHPFHPPGTLAPLSPWRSSWPGDLGEEGVSSHPQGTGAGGTERSRGWEHRGCGSGWLPRAFFLGCPHPNTPQSSSRTPPPEQITSEPVKPAWFQESA